MLLFALLNVLTLLAFQRVLVAFTIIRGQLDLHSTRAIISWLWTSLAKWENGLPVYRRKEGRIWPRYPLVSMKKIFFQKNFTPSNLILNLRTHLKKENFTPNLTLNKCKNEILSSNFIYFGKTFLTRFFHWVYKYIKAAFFIHKQGLVSTKKLVGKRHFLYIAMFT